MSTLETQYKNFLSDNQESEFTFDEWKLWLAKSIGDSMKRLSTENDLCENHWILKKEGSCVKCMEENNK
jgi:hypothetical protein